ncbi:MAG: amidohydrolase family protein [Planctomycetales bacterium]
MITDTNVWLGRYPTRRLPFDDTPTLVARLRENKVTLAWAGSFEMLLHQDMEGVNARLAEECRQHAPNLLLPFGGINPVLPDWEEDVRRCHEVHHMPGIRLTPGLHGYALDNPFVNRLCALASERNLLVQIVVRIDDERTQHPLLKAADVDVKPLIKLLPQYPTLKLMLLNGLHNAGVQAFLSDPSANRVSFDIATLEGVGGIEKTLKRLTPDRLCFGSHFPFFVWESAKLKLQESALPQPILEQITHRNAEALVRETGRK